MTDYHHLLGADDVRTGGYAVERGAQMMKDATGNLDFTLQQHQRFMDDWLVRFEAVVDKMNEAARAPGKGESPSRPATEGGGK